MALRHVVSSLTLEQATTIAIGAVGISGDTSDRDEDCAIEGVKAAGLACDPPEPAPDWREAGL